MVELWWKIIEDHPHEKPSLFSCHFFSNHSLHISLLNEPLTKNHPSFKNTSAWLYGEFVERCWWLATVALKRHQSLCQKCRWKITPKHAYTHKVRVGWLCCPGIARETVREMSLHTTRQGTLGHKRLCSLSHYELILASRMEFLCASWSLLKKKKIVQAGNEK